MLYMFDTRRVIQDLMAGGIPEPQAEAITQVWLGVLQDFQVKLQPEHAALRLERELFKFQLQIHSLQRTLERQPPRESTS